MPRVALTRQQKLNSEAKRISTECACKLKEYGIKQKDVAELLEISPQALSKQLTKRSVSLETYLAVQMLIRERTAE